MKANPICGMEVDETSAFRLESDGEVHYFRSGQRAS